MAVEMLYLAEDVGSYCKLVDPAGGYVQAPIVELSPQTALLNTTLSFMPHDYVNVTLQLFGTTPRTMFAHVVDVEGDNLRLRWLHFTPSDEAKLKSFLEAFASAPVLAKVSTTNGSARDFSRDSAHNGTRDVARDYPVASPAHRADLQTEQVTEPSADARIMVGADGKMDIGATIRSKAKTILASELAARHDKVHVLNMGTIKELIQDAVSEALMNINVSMSETEKKQLLEETEAKFQERLKNFQAEKVGAQEYAKHLNDQLRIAQNLLEEERKRTINVDQFTVSESGMGQIEERLRRVLDMAVKTGNVSPELEAKLRDMIAHILDEERERIRIQEQEAQGAKIDLLEKKLRRLASNLEEAERQRDQAQALANALEQNGGLHGIMLAGITDSDADKKRKLALMKQILDINRHIRDELGVTYNRNDEAVEQLERERLKLPDAKVATRWADDDAAEEADNTARMNKEIAAEQAAVSQDPQIDPDDMPWEVTDIKILTDEERDAAKAHNKSSIKRFSADSTAVPPTNHQLVG